MTHQFRMHVFVCTNERSPESPRGCCAAKNSLEILTRLKRAAKAEGLKDAVSYTHLTLPTKLLE